MSYHPARKLDQFRQVIAHCGFHDLGYVGSPFTWSKNNGSQGHLCIRLDIALVNTTCKQLFQGAVVHHLSPSTSDHYMLSLRIRNNRHCRRPFKKFFKFEEMWLRDLRCIEVVEDSWHEDLYKPDGHPMTNFLKSCRDRILTWNKFEFGHMGQRIDSLQKRLQALDLLPSNSTTDTEIREVHSALNVWLDAKNTMWEQHSRNFWLTEGDRNTSFFHTKATNCK